MPPIDIDAAGTLAAIALGLTYPFAERLGRAAQLTIDRISGLNC